MNRTFLRRVAGGVLTAELTYLLLAAVLRGRTLALLRPVGSDGSAAGPLAQAYLAGREPFARAVGWTFLTAHRLPVYVVREEVLAVGLRVPAETPWLYAVPAVACLAGGALVAAWDGPADPLPVGGAVTVGYVPATLAGVVVFRGPVGGYLVVPNVASVVTVDWPIAVVGFPFLFASFGAFLTRELSVARAALSA